MNKDTRKPGWYFLYWLPGEMQDAQDHSGPHDDLHAADAARRQLKDEGYLCGTPVFVGPKLPGEGQ